jgi:hypothetical protein
VEVFSRTGLCLPPPKVLRAYLFWLSSLVPGLYEVIQYTLPLAAIRMGGEFFGCLVIVGPSPCRMDLMSLVEVLRPNSTRAQHRNPACTCPDLLYGSRDWSGCDSPQLSGIGQQALREKTVTDPRIPRCLVNVGT